MPKYNVVSPVKFNGERIESGEHEFSPKAAKQLLDAGAIEEIKSKSKGKDKESDAPAE